METFKNNKKYVFLITYTVFLVFFLFNLEKINRAVNSFFSVMMPVIYGIVFAFLVGLIARGIRIFFRKAGFKGKKAEIVSVFFGYVIFLGLAAIFFVLVIPATNRSISNITQNLPHFWYVFYEFLKEIAQKLDLSEEQWAHINVYINQFYTNAYIFITSKLPDIIAYAFNLMGFLKNLLLGFMISIYLLISKKTLKIQIKKTITVLFSEEIARKIIDISKNAKYIFRRYISGQVIVSVVLGVICYLCMLLFKMPDAVLISLIIGISNLIPIIGPIVGTIPCTIIVMMTSPVKAFWFLILILVLQQLDNNLISPKIVGDSVGMNGLWVILAVFIGGALFGTFGMIIAVPTMGVIYHIFGEYINSRYNKEKYDELIQNSDK